MLKFDSCLPQTAIDGQVSSDDFALNIKDTIIRSYSNENLSSCESYWRRQFIERCEELNLKIKLSQGNSWSEISVAIKGKRKIVFRPTTTIAETATETKTSTSTSNSSIVTHKNHKLSSTERERAIIMYISLSKFWKLNTGVYVEAVLKKLVLESIFEHPPHSLILDPTDSN